jgi:cyclophilin family peptidyl-prolyl cis-trans isomerase
MSSTTEVDPEMSPAPRRYARLVRAALLLVLALPTAASATAVKVSTVLGDIYVALFPDVAPLTVANFLGYANRQAYDNSFFHRSMPGFVIQGGGYRATSGLPEIPTDPPVVNEFNRSNVRGTVAMAKLGGDPNSATSQWFINLVDNNHAQAPANLDADNGGYTVFGRVIGKGMEAVDAIATLTRVNAGAPFDNLPLTSMPADLIIREENLVMVRGVTVVPPRGDFDADGKADLFWRNAASGDNALWRMSGGTLTGSAFLPAHPGDWQVLASGDFDADGHTDLLWHHASGANALWRLQGATVVDGAYLYATGPEWQVAGVGDFDGDGNDDLLWRNSAGGEKAVWRMAGTRVLSGTLTLAVPDPAWQVAKVGDFDGDGRADLVWRNQATGENALWLMSGASVLASPYLPTVADASWQVQR